jgi:A118 family predicted phage portal protein|nr:MAG TPA: portal protein [Caudoviricetes sp.]
MGIISRMKEILSALFRQRARDDFKVNTVTSLEMQRTVEKCMYIYKGMPYWLDDDEHIKTVNFAKAVCSEMGRLTTLAIGITVDGSARADWLQKQINKVLGEIRHWTEFACAYGTVILKPNGKSVDLITPKDFIVTDESNGEIQGIVFINREVSGDGRTYYTKLEYHRYIEDVYQITNRCYASKDANDTGKPIDIDETPWKGELEDVGLANLDGKRLYGVLRTPQANSVDEDSSLGLPIFYDAIEELKDLDIAYSRNATEIFDSRRMVLIDSDRLMESGAPVKDMQAGVERSKKRLKLPEYVKNVNGTGMDGFYQEVNPSLNTSARIEGINALLSQIGYKCGFSNGYFVFNEKTGIQTATWVEADQQRTIQTVKDMRDKLQKCMNELINALSIFADLYQLSPVGTYEIVFDFGDITYNENEDRSRWYSFTVAGKVPFWYYLVKFEGFSEEEAKALVAEAQPKEPTLFGASGEE